MPLLVTAGAFFVYGTIGGTNLFSELMKDYTHLSKSEELH
ncbi:hypothetical protein CLV60_10834 [Dyadobacter jiangsuensis]|uniref:Uncharacterized protein n=1 Tax=Dyadobacter jiangsuensis TaxID=1591085 RepID=A0A2P8FZN1_9BACT|nr:hypothetical protein CLV60_10834 [Dyadobacter jiangsuensis]